MDFQSSRSSQHLTAKTVSVIAAAVTEFLGREVRIRSAKIVQTP
jgi:hypothetical protein